MKNIHFILFAFCLAGSIQQITAQSLVGSWQLMDEETGQPRTTIELFEQAGQYSGRILVIHIGDPEAVCDDCPGELKGQSIEGLQIIYGLRPASKPHQWKKGTIINPLSGKKYRLSAWFKAGRYDELYLRGKHWTGLYKSQVWRRVSR